MAGAIDRTLVAVQSLWGLRQQAPVDLVNVHAKNLDTVERHHEHVVAHLDFLKAPLSPGPRVTRFSARTVVQQTMLPGGLKGLLDFNSPGLISQSVEGAGVPQLNQPRSSWRLKSGLKPFGDSPPVPEQALRMSNRQHQGCSFTGGGGRVQPATFKGKQSPAHKKRQGYAPERCLPIVIIQPVHHCTA